MDTRIKELIKANNGFLKTKDFHSRSEWRELQKLLDDNSIVKVKNGLYRVNEVVINQHIEASKIVPDGVFCLFTAWQHYNLSVYNPFEFYMAIRKKQKVVLPAYPPIKLFYWIDKYYLLGITETFIDCNAVKIYDLEKSVCDVVRFRKKVGIEMTSEILKNYLKRQDKDLNKLWQYSCLLRIERIMKELVTMML